MPPDRSLEVAAAVSSSSSIPLATNFLDHIKTRIQSRPAVGSTSQAYSPHLLIAARRLLREEGVLSLYLTGMSASITREAATQVFRLGGYPFLRDILSRTLGGDGGGEAAVTAKLAAGLLGGAASGVAASPFDLARIRLQAEAGRYCEATGLLQTGLRAGLPPRATSMVGTLVLAVREGGGAAALSHGMSVNALRAATINVATVPVYEHTKHLAKKHLGVADTPSLHLGSGIVAGLVGTTAAAPVDVVRTRLMTAPRGASHADAVLGIWRDAGLRGFLRGWWPAYMRLGPVLLFYPALVEQVRIRVFGLGPIV